MKFLMLRILNTSLTHNIEEARMGLKGTLGILQARNQFVRYKSFEYEKINVYELNEIVIILINIVEFFNL